MFAGRAVSSSAASSASVVPSYKAKDTYVPWQPAHPSMSARQARHRPRAAAANDRTPESALYGSGPSSVPIGAMLDDLLEQRPFKDQLFVSAGTEQHKWGRDETREHVSATARGLLEYGFKNGAEMLTWTGPTEVETLMAVLGAAHTGAHVTGLDGDLPASAVNQALGERGSRGLLVGRARCGGKDRAQELVAPGPGVQAMGQVPGLEGAACPTLRMHERFSSTGVVQSQDLPNLRYVFDASHPREVNGFLGFFQMPVYHAAPCPLPRVAPFVDVSAPLYTAGHSDGSGGIRWGESVSQAGAMDLAGKGAKALGLTAQDVVLVTAPMHSSATMLGVCLGALQAGAKLLLPGRSFDAFQVASAITRQRPTVLVCTPEQLDATHKELEKGPDRLSPRMLRHEKDRIRSYNASSLRSVAVDVAGGGGGAQSLEGHDASMTQFDSSKDSGAF